LLLALLVGLSRIALGVHFPLDVISGAVIGAAFSIVACWLARRFLARRERAS
jgi:undecaprenyl-diphosphatase